MRRDPRLWLLVTAVLLLGGVAIVASSGAGSARSGPLEREPHPGTGSSDATGAPVLEGRQPRQVTGGLPPSRAGEVYVRDVRTGKPISGLALRVAPREGPAWETVSSATGVIHLGDAEAAVSAAPGAEDWILAEEEFIATGGRVLWLYRIVEIRGRVRVSGGADAHRLQETTVTVAAPRPQHTSREAPSEAIGSYPWMSRRGLHQVRERIDVHGDGSFSARIPRLGGYYVAATLAFVGAAQAKLEFQDTDEVVEGIELVLEERFTWSGVVRDQSGEGLARAKVHYECVVHGTADELDALYEAAQARGLAVATLCAPGRGCELWIQGETRTDASGAYQIEVLGGVELRIIVAVPGHRILRTSAGYVTGSRSDLELSVHSFGADSPRCQLLGDGVPLVGHDVGATTTDVRSFVPRLGTTDASGRFPTEWLEMGQYYALRVTAPSGKTTWYFVRWANDLRLETNELAKEREDVK